MIDGCYSFIDPEERNREAADTLLVLGLMVKIIWGYLACGLLFLWTDRQTHLDLSVTALVKIFIDALRPNLSSYSALYLIMKMHFLVLSQLPAASTLLAAEKFTPSCIAGWTAGS